MKKGKGKVSKAIILEKLQPYTFDNTYLFGGVIERGYSTHDIDLLFINTTIVQLEKLLHTKLFSLPLPPDFFLLTPREQLVHKEGTTYIELAEKQQFLNEITPVLHLRTNKQYDQFPLRCPFCGAEFYLETNIQTHMTTIHNDSIETLTSHGDQR